MNTFYCVQLGAQGASSISCSQAGFGQGAVCQPHHGGRGHHCQHIQSQPKAGVTHTSCHGAVMFGDVALDVFFLVGCHSNGEMGRWKPADQPASACPPAAERGKQGTGSGRWGLGVIPAPGTRHPLHEGFWILLLTDPLTSLFYPSGRIKLDASPLNGWGIRRNTEMSQQNWFFWSFRWNSVLNNWLAMWWLQQTK